jgi:hypothetical protein
VRGLDSWFAMCLCRRAAPLMQNKRYYENNNSRGGANNKAKAVGELHKYV